MGRTFSFPRRLLRLVVHRSPLVLSRMVKILEQPENQKSAMMNSSHEGQSVGSSTGVCNCAREPGVAPPERVPGCREPDSPGPCQHGCARSVANVQTRERCPAGLTELDSRGELEQP